MGDTDYNAKSIDAVVSRIEAKIDQHGTQLTRMEDFMVKQAQRVNALELSTAETKAATKTAIKISSAVAGFISAIVSGGIVAWFSKK